MVELDQAGLALDDILKDARRFVRPLRFRGRVDPGFGPAEIDGQSASA